MAYKRSILTFLDILGFRQLVEGKDAAHIKEVLGIIHTAAKPDEKLANLMEISFLTFSDCTVRAVPVDSAVNKKHPDGILFHEFLNLVHTQARLIHAGYFIRGGVTVGDVFIEGSMVFGPAMNKAYGIESEFAV